MCYSNILIWMNNFHIWNNGMHEFLRFVYPLGKHSVISYVWICVSTFNIYIKKAFSWFFNITFYVNYIFLQTQSGIKGSAKIALLANFFIQKSLQQIRKSEGERLLFPRFACVPSFFFYKYIFDNDTYFWGISCGTFLLQITAKTKAFILYPSVFLPQLLACYWWVCDETWPLMCDTFCPVSGCIWLEGGGRLQLGLRRVQHIISMASGGQCWLKTCHLTLWPHFKEARSGFFCARPCEYFMAVHNRKGTQDIKGILKYTI